MGFWKRYSYQIVRLFVIQIGIAIFGLVLSFAVSTAFRDRNPGTALLLVSIFSVLFYLSILYSVVWEIGGKDRIHLDAVHEKLRGGKGLLLALLASVPNLLLDLLMLIGGTLYRFGSTSVGSGFIVAGFTPSFFIQSMYQGIINRILSAFGLIEPGKTAAGSASYYLVTALLFFAVLVPMIAVTGFAYWMGLNEKRLIPSAKKPTPGDKN